LPPSPQQLDVVMTEYAFQHLAELPPGRTVFQVRNAGSLPHSLVLVELPEDFPPLAEQLVSDVRRAVPTLAQVPERPPGSRDTFAVDLEPGRYGLICFVMDPDGVLHARKGMSSELRVA
jgi:hypothetical protein